MTTWNQASQPSTTWGNDTDAPGTSWGATSYFLNGRPIGLLLALTYTFSSIPTDDWTAVNSPTTSWVSAT